MFKNKLLISEDKKDIVEVISTNGCKICCDNKPMKELVANSTNAAQENTFHNFRLMEILLK